MHNLLVFNLVKPNWERQNRFDDIIGIRPKEKQSKSGKCLRYAINATSKMPPASLCGSGSHAASNILHDPSQVRQRTIGRIRRHTWRSSLAFIRQICRARGWLPSAWLRRRRRPPMPSHERRFPHPFRRKRTGLSSSAGTNPAIAAYRACPGDGSTGLKHARHPSSCLSMIFSENRFPFPDHAPETGRLP